MFILNRVYIRFNRLNQLIVSTRGALVNYYTATGQVIFEFGCLSSRLEHLEVWNNSHVIQPAQFVSNTYHANRSAVSSPSRMCS